MTPRNGTPSILLQNIAGNSTNHSKYKTVRLQKNIPAVGIKKLYLFYKSSSHKQNLGN